MDENCCHCFNPIRDMPHVKCCACNLKIHARCLNMTDNEIKLITNIRSTNVKLFCNRCNVTVSAVSELKGIINELKDSFNNRFAQLEDLIRVNSVAVNSREEMIDESVERSIRACNVVVYNVKENSQIRDVDFVNDVIEAIDPSLVVSPEEVSRLGKPDGNRPRPLKLRFKTPEMARLCLKKKSALLTNPTYAQIFIKDDKTPRQLQHLKSLRSELNQRVTAGETDLTIKYVNRVPQIITKQKN